MMTLVAKTFTADFRFSSTQAIEDSLNEALDRGDTSAITKMLGDLARSRGMARVADATGFRRESLYRSLVADGNPRIGTIMKVFKALGMRISVSYQPPTPPTRNGL